MYLERVPNSILLKRRTAQQSLNELLACDLAHNEPGCYNTSSELANSVVITGSGLSMDA